MSTTLSLESGGRFYRNQPVVRAAPREVNVGGVPHPVRRETAHYAASGVLANSLGIDYDEARDMLDDD